MKTKSIIDCLTEINPVQYLKDYLKVEQEENKLLRAEIIMLENKIKAEKCCEVGTHKCTTPMPINGRSVDINICIADIVAALNAANIPTVASCCGHGKILGSIILDDGRDIKIRNFGKQKEQR